MFVWKEIRDGRTIVLDEKGDNPARAWYIPGASVDAARVDTNPSRPERGDPHPDDPNIVALKISYAPWLAGTRCEAQYIPAEHLPEEEDTTTDIDFFDGDGHTYHIKREVPVIHQVKQSFEGAGNPDLLIWRRLDSNLIAPFEYPATEFTMEVIAEIPSTPALDVMLLLLDKLREEDGKIHRINGTDYEFGSEGTDRISKDKYRMNYRWRSDPGLPNTLAYTDTFGANWAKVGTHGYGFYDNELIIPGFSRVDIGGDVDANGDPDPTKVPLFVVSPTRKRNENGWRSLPGIQV